MNFNKIYDALNELLEFGLIYSDMNINNFIVGEEDDEIYLIDFEDTVASNNMKNTSELVERIPGGIQLNKKYIKTQLENSIISIKVRKRYKSSSSSDSSGSESESSARKTAKKKKQKTTTVSPSSPHRKTTKNSSNNSPKSPKK